MAHKRINVDLLIEIKGVASVDLSAPQFGNPGIGGSQYCFLLLAFFLNNIYGHLFKVRIVSYEPLKLPAGIENIVVRSLQEVLEVSAGSVLIIRQFNALEPYDIINRFPEARIILWSHNFLHGPEADKVAAAKGIKGNVFVSRQMYDFYADHDLIRKSVAIFNMVPDVETMPRRLPDKPVLTFMGNISEGKGIITLLKVWRKVKARFPEAQLNIIGKGNLYNRNLPVGELGITDAATEKKMLPYITNPDGSLQDNVHFLGILGNEKYDVFANSSVGLVNPSAKTETFGMGIIEMASASLPVVTRNWNGHPDTAVNNETALLGLSVNDMARCVIRLITDRNLNMRLGENAKREVKRFAPENITPQWAELIKRVAEGKTKYKRLPLSQPYWNNYKFLRAANSKLRFNLKLAFLPPIVNIESAAYSKIRSLLSIRSKLQK